jgi:phage-related protein
MTKPVDWRGSSLKDLQEFPDDAKRRYGAVLIERKLK